METGYDEQGAHETVYPYSADGPGGREQTAVYAAAQYCRRKDGKGGANLYLHELTRGRPGSGRVVLPAGDDEHHCGGIVAFSTYRIAR